MSDSDDWKQKLVDWIPCGLSQCDSRASFHDTLNDNNGECGLNSKALCQGLVNCFGDQKADKLDDNRTSLKDLPENVLIKILLMLNHGDLVQCRLVQKNWNFLISASDSFLDSTVYCLSTDREVGLQVFGTFTPYRNTKFLAIDYEVYLKKVDFDHLYCENYFFHPSQRFLQNIKRLECLRCFLTWDTLKRILTSTLGLEHLIISQCILSDEVSRITSLEPAQMANPSFKDVLGKLKKITLLERLDLHNINRILSKLLSFASRSLQDIHIQYKPAESTTVAEDGDIMTFCHSLLHIIQVNSPSLKNLTLELEDEAIINRIPPMIGKLESFWKTLKLTSFCLNPLSSVKITQDSIEAAKIFAKFFQSQTTLTNVSIPFLERNISVDEEIFNKTIDSIVPSLPPSLKNLVVPSASYIWNQSIFKFISLESISIGAQGKETSIDFLHFSAPSNENEESHDWKNLRHLEVTKYFGYNIGELIIPFSGLTSLKIAGEVNFIRDTDIQAMIRYLPGLQYLNLANLDHITDFGISGVALDVCERMIDLGTYPSFQNVDFTENFLGEGRPLYNLTGLRYLSLEGKSNITDFGINFGIKFLELKYIRLPWSEQVTDWGIRRLASRNPSLEKVDLCGVNKLSLDAFMNMTKYNPRIKNNLCSYDAVYNESPDLLNMITCATCSCVPKLF